MSTIIYVVASLALSGVLPASDIDPTSGFSEAFFSRGIDWAGKRRVSSNGLIYMLGSLTFLQQVRLQRLVKL